MDLLSSNQDAGRLLSMLSSSWGQSKVSDTAIQSIDLVIVVILSLLAIITRPFELFHFGHSKILELTLTDYISALKVAGRDSSAGSTSKMSCSDLLSNASAGLRQSAAPLRNMAKDMDCVVGELSAEELGLDQGKARLPVMTASHEAIQRACSQEVSRRRILRCYCDIHILN